MELREEEEEGERDSTSKFYFPIHGENDQKIITGLAEFMCRIGLSKLGENYETTVQHYLYVTHSFESSNLFLF